jgi:hypothetical protein
MRTLIFFAATIFMISCGEQKAPSQSQSSTPVESQTPPEKASTDLVNIPATADSANAPDNASIKKAVITFEKNVHDFGTITQGEAVEYEFIFKNTGNQDLLVANAQASCGCTIPEFSKAPIRPGGEGRIKVKFNSDHRIDRFQKEVYVTANTEPVQTMLVITGLVIKKPEAQLQH